MIGIVIDMVMDMDTVVTPTSQRRDTGIVMMRTGAPIMEDIGKASRSRYAVAKKKCGSMPWVDSAESGSVVCCRGRSTGAGDRGPGNSTF